MKMMTLQDLFVQELRHIYNAEHEITKALPRMAKAASSEELKEAFEAHLDQTRGQIERLDRIFEKLGKRATGKRCKAVEALIEEGKELLDMDAEPHVLDAALIAAAQKVEHFEMAAYGCVRNWAHLLGDEDSGDLLQETLDEEGETDELLTELAEGLVNLEAAQAG